MLYVIYQHLAQGGHYVPVLNLLRYLTFRTGLSLFTAQLVVAMMGNNFIAWMRTKQGRGQPIRSDGIERHVVEKAGTPTMGGFMILAGLVVATLLWGDLTNPYVWTALVVTAGYGLLGFLDDYKKVTKQSAAGISGSMKLVIQFVIAIGAAAVLVWATHPATGEPARLSTSLAFPLLKNLLWNLGWFYVAFAAIITGPIAKPSRPSVRFTALEAPTITTAAKAM